MYRLIFNAIVGGIIGSLTNYLAIKMLFRPYEEKRVFGIKIPFTPGLIPKQVKRIANSISETIGIHLLDEKTILSGINDFDVKTHLNKITDKKIEEYIQNESTIRDLINEFYGETDIIEELKNLINKSIYELDFDFDKIVKGYLVSYIDSENQIGKYIPEKLDAYISQVIHDKTPDIAHKIQLVLQSETVEYKIKDSIRKYISSKAGLFGFMGSLINVDSIYEALKPELYKIMEDEDIKDFIEKEIINYKNEALNKKLSELPNFDQEELISLISGHISQSISEYIKSESGEKAVKNKISDIVDKLADTKIEKLVSGKNYVKFNNIKNIIFDRISDFIFKSASEIITYIDIQKLVREKIDEFDIRFIEKLIIDIAGQELKAINILEGVLGVLMGIVSAYLFYYLKL